MKDNKLSKEKRKPDEKTKFVIYIMLSLFIMYCLVIFLPFIVDYYLDSSGKGFIAYYIENCADVEGYYFFGSIIIACIAVVLYLLFLNCGISFLTVSVCAFLLAFASRIKYENRKELLNISDLRLTEAAGMALNYLKVRISKKLIFFILGIIVFTVLLLFIEKLHVKRKEHLKNRKFMLVRFVLIVAVIAGVRIYSNKFMESKNVIFLTELEATALNDTNQYVIYSFFESNHVSFDDEGIMESYEYLKDLSVAGKSHDKNITPNVIVIMNESWWNTDNISGSAIELSSDPMEPYHELEDLCTTGYVSTNIFGGGTISSEDEFLTGLNSKYFTASANFHEFVEDGELGTIVDYFNALGYDTTAIHPYYGSFYDRDVIYKNFGFDNIIFDDDMKYTDIYSRYISDSSLSRQIIYEYEKGNDSGESDFIWAVSIGNHRTTLDYKIAPVENYDYPIDVKLNGVTLDDEEYDILVNYINGIYYANLAYKELVDYFSNVEEPTVILMYGDHIPNFSDEMLELMGLDQTDESLEMKQRIYTTPVILWSNFSDENLDISGETINYLDYMLIDYCGLPDSNMTKILRYMRTQFKANTRYYILDKDNNKMDVCSNEQVKAVYNFNVLQYDMLIGSNLCSDIWEPIIEK